MSDRDMALAAALRAVADAMVIGAATRAGVPGPIAGELPTIVEGGAQAVQKRRKRRASAYNRTWAKCRAEVEKRARTKSGAYRKGWSNARVMKEAHKLCKRRMK